MIDRNREKCFTSQMLHYRMEQLKESLSAFLQDEIQQIDTLADGYLSVVYKATGKQHTYIIRTNKGTVP